MSWATYVDTSCWKISFAKFVRMRMRVMNEIYACSVVVRICFSRDFIVFSVSGACNWSMFRG